MKNSKPHAVLLALPAQGHVSPMMQLASLLQARGFFITFVNTEFNHERLIRSKGVEWMQSFKDFRFETIAEGLPQSNRDGTKELCGSIRRSWFPAFRDLLSKLVSDADVPLISCIVADGLMSSAVKAGAEFGIPVALFWTASACGFMAYLQYRELVNRGIIPFKDENFMNDGSLEKQLDWIPGMRNMRLKDIPSFVRTTNVVDNVMFNYLADESQNCLNASALIFNTFVDLEHQVLDAIASISPPMYSIGPLYLLSNAISGSQAREYKPSLWKEDETCLRWLDGREENSVVYVNFGSVTLISEDHLIEFAWGLANSKLPFLWIVRADIAMGESPILPKDFIQETKDRCLITTWCPQEDVLSHPSVGVFLNHCGWNSTLESIGSGVPILCWPFFAEQQTNCRYACVEWGMGLEMDCNVNRDEIEALMKSAMEGQNWKEIKAKALEWKQKAKEATRVGSSSYNDFDRFVNETLKNVQGNID